MRSNLGFWRKEKRASQLAALSVILSIAFAPGGRGEEGETRVAISLTAPEKAYVLGQMRLFVASVQEIVAALAAGDRASAAKAAAARGAKRQAMEQDMPPTLPAKLPETWKTLGRPMRQEFDALAQGLAAGEDTSRSLARLGEVMRNCVGCHAAYRLVDAQD
jgi:hypothetical protein